MIRNENDRKGYHMLKVAVRAWIVVMVLGLTAMAESLSVPGFGSQSLDHQQLKTLHLMNAPIHKHSRLGTIEIKRFIAMEKKDKTLYGKAYPDMKKALSAAAKVLPEERTSFEQFIQKAIELSQKKEELDKNAQQYGYPNALEQTVQSHRIIRAMMTISVAKKLQTVPTQMREMVQEKIRAYMPPVNEKDINYVLPYMGLLKTLAKDM